MAIIKKIIRAIRRLFVRELYVTVYPGDFIAVSKDLYSYFEVVQWHEREDFIIFTFWMLQFREFAFCFRTDSPQLREHPQLEAFPLEVDLKANLIGFKVGKGLCADILNRYGLPYDKPARLKVSVSQPGQFPVYTILPPAAH